MTRMKENKGSLQERNHIGWLVLGMALVLCPFVAYAHPHAWIDVRSTIIMSPNGMISAIEQEWLFDGRRQTVRFGVGDDAVIRHEAMNGRPDCPSAFLEER